MSSQSAVPHPSPLPKDADLCRAWERLQALLTELGELVVAYSGGVDSTFLLRVAHDLLGERALGVLAVSESLDRNELAAARELARAEGLPIREIRTSEYDNPDYRRNDADRCYHCKHELFVRVREVARQEGFAWVADGSHAGDIGDHRPGLRARDEEGVRSPLLEAGLDKSAIRQFSRALGLPTWDKPAAPCLSSRIPYGSEVTADKLEQVEAAEKALRDLGFSVLRVRHHGDVARLEVPPDRFAELLSPETRSAVTRAVREAGFQFVALDIEGFRSGSLNSALSPTQRGLAPSPRTLSASPQSPLVQLDPPRRALPSKGPGCSS